jgi:uncharacterized protein (DUF488 family)
MLNQIYTVGYQSLKKIDDLVDLARLKKAAVVDIRYHPWSKDEQWQGEEINKIFIREKLFGTYYQCRQLGNVNYRDKLPIKLWNPEAGIETISKMLRNGPVILLCACWDLLSCHRLVAAALLEKELGVQVEHIHAVPKEALPKLEKATPPPTFWQLPGSW